MPRQPPVTIAWLERITSAAAPRVVKPKRKYVRSPEAQLGLPPASKRPPGRPQGAKNKPKPEGYVRPPKRSPPAFTRTVAREHYRVVNGTLWRLVGGKLDRNALTKRHGTSTRGRHEEWAVRWKNQWVPANTVAWWLIMGTDVPDDMFVVCMTEGNRPYFAEDTLSLHHYEAKHR